MPRLPPLYAIVDDDLAQARGYTSVGVAEAFLRAGVRCVQFRAKSAGSADVLARAGAIAELARQCDAHFIVNDRADIARLVGAGVHVGQDDLPSAAARRLVGDGVLVGISTHTPEQVAEALQQPVSYVAVGPVFGTATKDTGYGPVGLTLVRAAVRGAEGRMPIVAIGGITLEQAPAVLDSGAAAVAVIGDLLTHDPGTRATAWIAGLAGR